MRVWKHHIAEHFIEDPSLLSDNGAGAGGTVFTDFVLMRRWLAENDDREFYAAPIDTTVDKLDFDCSEPFMATATEYLPSESGFAPIEHWLRVL